METDITMMMGSVGLMEKSMVGEDHEDEKERALKRYGEIISMLPKEEGWSDSRKCISKKGFGCHSRLPWNQSCGLNKTSNHTGKISF